MRGRKNDHNSVKISDNKSRESLTIEHRSESFNIAVLHWGKARKIF